jgi:hypothetical protein
MIAVQSMADPGRSKGGLVDNGARKNSCLDRDDFRLNQSEIMTAIYFNSLERDFRGKPLPTFPHPACLMTFPRIRRIRTASDE